VGTPRLTSAAEPARTRPATTVVLLLWGALLTYWFLSESSHEPAFPLMTYVSGAIIWMAIWAALERMRWGRLAVIAVAGFSLFDVAAGAYLLMAAPPRAARAYCQGLPPIVALLGAYGGSAVLGAFAVVVWAGTIVWMLRPAVREEYVRGKSQIRKRWQCYIATAVLAAGIPGMWGTGARWHVSRVVGGAGARAAKPASVPAAPAPALR
jgi:hypothetical protein